ncbi:MAG: hypothetical protein RLZZ293_1042 [Pseudomonadota bacterium]|jgi:Holliday junction DNA helicase RuvA
MISILHGKLIDLATPQITLMCNGVGYELDLPMSHLAQLPPLGSDIQLYTHLVVREDAHLLFGFITKTERDCFRQLLKVSGIGARIALALLTTMNSEQLYLAIEQGDLTSLIATPGVGKKMAERMVLELKGKLIAPLVTNRNIDLVDATIASHNIKRDLNFALESLGYNSKQIHSVLQQLTDLTDLNQSIKQALKLLTKH